MQIRSSLDRCRSVTSKPRLRDTVVTVDTESGCTTALLLDSVRPAVAACDGDGVVRVWNYLQSTTLNRFHVAKGVPNVL